MDEHPIPSLRDGGFLHGDPPALWGIVPAKTRVEEAHVALERNGALRACREYRHPETGATGIACWPWFHLAHRDGIVRFVEFQPSIAVTMADVLDARGEPDAVLCAYTDFPDGKIYSVLILYFDRIWTSVMLAEQAPRVYRVEPDTTVARITYAKPVHVEAARARRVRWAGYGDYPASDATSG